MAAAGECGWERMDGSWETDRARLPPAEKPSIAVRERDVLGRLERSMGRDSSASAARRRASTSCSAVGNGCCGDLE